MLYGSATASVTTGPLDLHIDANNGDDDNPGTRPGSPLRTVDELIRRLPDLANHPIIAHFAAGTYDAYSRPLTTVGRHPVVLIGDDRTVLLSGTAQAGSDASTLVTSGGLTPEEFLGAHVRITSGDAEGSERTIKRNTGTDILPAAAFKAAVQDGDTFEVFVPAARIRIPDRGAFGATNPAIPLALNMGGGPSVIGDIPPVSGDSPGLLLANLDFTTEVGAGITQFITYQTNTQMYGVRLVAEDGLIVPIVGDSGAFTAGMAGNTPPDSRTPLTLGLIDDADDWDGYGLALPEAANNVSTFRMTRFGGYLVSAVPLSARYACEWSLVGGSIIPPAGAFGPSLDVRSPSAVVSVTGASGRFIIKSSGDEECIVARGGGRVRAQEVLCEKSGPGSAVLVTSAESGQEGMPGMLSIDDGDFQAQGLDEGSGFPEDALTVTSGGIAHLTRGATITTGGTFTENVLVVRRQEGGAVIEGAASLAADGDALPAPATADGRFGWIRRI